MERIYTISAEDQAINAKRLSDSVLAGMSDDDLIKTFQHLDEERLFRAASHYKEEIDRRGLNIDWL